MDTGVCEHVTVNQCRAIMKFVTRLKTKFDEFGGVTKDMHIRTPAGISKSRYLIILSGATLGKREARP